MMGVPVARQVLEAIIFYVPSPMSQTDAVEAWAVGKFVAHIHSVFSHLVGEQAAHFVGFF
jgi:hypothetical protein